MRWSRAWRGHLWHARRYAWDIDRERINGTAECGFRPSAARGYAVTHGARWVETVEREPRPTHRASNGQWLHDVRCAACVDRRSR